MGRGNVRTPLACSAPAAQGPSSPPVHIDEHTHRTQCTGRFFVSRQSVEGNHTRKAGECLHIEKLEENICMDLGQFYWCRKHKPSCASPASDPARVVAR